MSKTSIIYIHIYIYISKVHISQCILESLSGKCLKTKMHELNENLGYYATRTTADTCSTFWYTYVKSGTIEYARHMATMR